MKIRIKISNKRLNTISKEEINIQKESLAASKKANKISIASAVATSLIAVFGLAISILSCLTYKNQLDLEKINSRPIINIEIFYNDDKSNITGLEITNEGEPAGNIDVDVIPYLEVCTNDIPLTNNMNTAKTIYLPIKYADYSVSEYNTKKGLICNVDFTDICEKYINDFTEMFKLDTDSISSEFIVTQVSIEYFVNINYSDVVGEEHNELYLCTPNYYVDCNSNLTYSTTVSMREMELEAIDNDTSLSEIYKDIGEPGLVADSNGPAYYDGFGETPTEKLDNFKEKITEAYEKQQFIN